MTSVVVGAITGGVQLVSLFKEVAVAGFFGPGDQLDAFFIAYMLPAFAINVLGWSLNSALIPAYVGMRERSGSEAADAMLAGVTSRTLALLFTASVLLAIVFPFVLPRLATSFAVDKLALTTRLFFILLPSLTLSALAVVWSGVLNAHGTYGTAAAAPALVPVVMVLAILVTGHRLGVHAIAVGLLVGTTLQCAALAAALRRRRVSLRPRWGPLTPAVRDVFHQYAPAMAGAMLSSSTALVDQSMSAALGSGQVATLNYGSKLVSAMLGVGMVAIGTAVLPHFSRLAAREDWDELRASLRRYTTLLIVVSIPVTLVLVGLSAPIVALLFERGAFRPEDTVRVAWVQQLFALQIPFYLVGILIVRVISALRRNEILMWGAFGNVVLNITFNLYFMRRFGLAGIALSTTLVYVVSASVLGALLWRHVARLRQEAHGRTSTPLADASVPPTAPSDTPIAEPSVTLVVPSLAAGGAERVVSTMANHWARAGHSVSVITIDSAHADFYRLDAHVRRYALGLQAPSRNVWHALRQSWRRISHLRSALRDSGATHVVSFVERTNVIATAASMGLDVALVLAERTDPRAHRIGRLWNGLRRLTYPRAAAIVVQTASVREWAIAWLRADRVYVIPNPIDPARWHIPEPRSPRERTIVGVGRLSTEKGFDLLLHAFARVAPAFPDWELTILGEGPLRGELESLAESLGIAGRVAMPGNVASPECVLRTASVFVLPSRFEGFPNALIEAMASGCAVIAADCPSGPRHIVRDQDNGLLVAPESPAALGDALLRLLRDATERERLGRAAESVLLEYDADQVMRRWNEVLADATHANVAGRRIPPSR